MRQTLKFEGKRHMYDTDKAVVLGHKNFGEFGDAAGYEETLMRNRAGYYFLVGIGGELSPYPNKPTIRPVTKSLATEWLAA